MEAKGSYLGEAAQRSQRDKLLEEFRKLDFSPDILSEARVVWDEVSNGIQKNSKRKELFFFCLYIAHIQLKIVQDHEYIAAQVGLSLKLATRSFIEFSETKTGFKVPVVEFKISDFLRMYVQRLGLDEDLEEIMADYQQLLDAPDSIDKRKLLKVTKPQNVATALIDNYQSQKCTRMTQEQYKLLYKKKETINTVKTKIIHVLYQTN